MGNSYNTREQGYPFRLRGQNQQTNTGLLYTPPSVTTNQIGGDQSARSSELLTGLALGYASWQYRGGSTAVTGIGCRLPNRFWIAGQWTNASATFTDDTADAQSTATGDFPLETTTANDGYLIASPYPFNALSLKIATASTGSPVRDVAYSNAAGTGWTTLTNLFVQDGAAGNLAITSTNATEALVVFDVPSDWGVSSSLATGLLDGLYALRVRATTAPSIAAIATCLEVCRLYLLQEATPDNTQPPYEMTASLSDLWMEHGEAGVALFSTADPGNRVTAAYRVR